MAGLAAGLSIAFASVRSLSVFLYGVQPRDSVTFLVVPAAVVMVIALASVVPARRAARIDPLRALKGE